MKTIITTTFVAIALLHYEVLAAKEEIKAETVLVCSLGDGDKVNTIAKIYDSRLVKKFKEAIDSRSLPKTGQKRVLLEPGPFFIFLDAKGNAISAVLLNLDGWISFYQVHESHGKWTIQNEIKNEANAILDSTKNEDMQALIGLWRMSVQ